MDTEPPKTWQSLRWGSGSVYKQLDHRQRLTCIECQAEFNAEGFTYRCDTCQVRLDARKAQGLDMGPSINRRSLMGKERQHSVTTVDDKTYYIDEYAKKKVYKRYIDYEMQEKRPMLKQASELYRRSQGKKGEPNVPNSM